MNDSGISRVPVVIVGAGPTGVTAATLLAQHGVGSLLLERWPGVYPQPRAVHLDDEIYRVIARLGIAQEFSAISRPTLGLRLLDNKFRVLGEFRRDPARSKHGFPQANMFDQPQLEVLLRTNLARYPDAELRGEADVTDISQLSDRIRVTYIDRTSGRVRQVDADFLLGCDGANSVVRQHIGATMQDLNFEQRWLVVDVATDEDLGQWDGVHQLCDPVRAGTYMRIGKSRYRWEFQLLSGETADDFATLHALRPLISPWTADVPDRELTLLRVTEYTFRAQLANRWRCGHVFILGDAAHLTPPFIGQGMGAGLRDATNLCWKIAAVRAGTLPPEALDSYEQERKPHTRHMIRLALAVGRSMTGGGRWGDLTRRAIMPRLRLIPGLRDKVVDSTTPALHRSALVRKSRLCRDLAGTLCPNALLREGRRIDDVAGAGFTLIVRDALPDADVAALQRCKVVVLQPDSDSQLDEWLRRGRVTAVLVRPDRTVMSAGRSAVDYAVAWASSEPLANRLSSE